MWFQLSSVADLPLSSFDATALSYVLPSADPSLNLRLNFYNASGQENIGREYAEGQFTWEDGLMCLCSSSEDPKEKVFRYTTELAHQLMGGNTAPASDVVLEHSCVVYDSKPSILWLLGDSYGRYPLWYSFSSQTHNNSSDHPILISNDLIGSHILGFDELNAVGPNQKIVIDLKTSELLEIVDIYRPHDQQKWLKGGLGFAMQIWDAAMESTAAAWQEHSSMNSRHEYPPFGSPSSNVKVVRDVEDVASIIGNCVVAAQGLRHASYDITSLVSDNIGLPEEEMVEFHALTGGLLDVRDLATKIWKPSFDRIAAERWRLCASSETEVVVDFSNFLRYRPLQVYLQNYFCSYYGKSVIYPLASKRFLDTLLSAKHPKSFLQDAPSILKGNDLCEFQWNATVGFRKGLSFEGTNDATFPPKLSSRSKFLSNLKLLARQHSGEDRVLFVVMATSGYKSMLSNFLCSVKRVIKSDRLPNVLVVTPNSEITKVCASANVASFLLTEEVSDHLTAGLHSLRSVDFGSLSYQSLMLLRTRLVMDLLLLGFRPVVADIDTVWLQDPNSMLLEIQANSSVSYDLVVTDDEGEVCGCFVALNNTEAAIRFWATVLHLHEQLVHFATHNNSGKLQNFAESEQKILTSLLKQGNYTEKLNVFTVPQELMPSGLQYFNAHRCFRSQITPVVVHNNFVIGNAAKISRFHKYGLWKYRSSSSSDVCGRNPDTDLMDDTCSKSETLLCDYDGLHDWRRVFDVVERDIRVPALNLVLPIHGTRVHGERVMVQATTEGMTRDESSGDLYIDNDPPSFIHFKLFGVYEIALSHMEYNILGLSALLRETNIAVYVDLAVNRSIFAFDRGGWFHQMADEFVLELWQNRVEDDRDVSMVTVADIKPALETIDTKDDDSFYFQLKFHIKVLAFNRVASLSRLLSSLQAADYMNETVSLEIFIDGPRTPEDLIAISEVADVVERFSWSFGTKIVTRRQHNHGLAKQWFNAWSPTVNSEVAFIFEDDIEVSPLFFRWSYSAAKRYYAENAWQREAHLDLLAAVRDEIRLNASSDIYKSYKTRDTVDLSPMQSFAKRFAGRPLLYGICLQKQHLDASHYPRRLNIQNGHRPFLYSLIGSWGPLLFASTWQAFREWWVWRSEEALRLDRWEPATENLVVNYFYRTNTKIWTPWMVRFAFETGLKCLYSNLPDSFSLVTNHRESGENYGETKGAESTNIQMDLLTCALASSTTCFWYPTLVQLDSTVLFGQREKNNSIENQETSCSNFSSLRQCDFNRRLLLSLGYFPPMEIIARWQFDYNLRRAGSVGTDSLFPWDRDGSDSTGVKAKLLWRELSHLSQWSEHFAESSGRFFEAHQCAAVMELLDRSLLPGTTIVHLGVSPVTLLMLLRGISGLQVILDETRHSDSCSSMISLLQEHSLHWVAQNVDFLEKSSLLKCSSGSQQLERNRSELTHSSIDIFVVAMSQAAQDKTLRLALSQFGMPRWIYAIGSCLGAPTDIAIGAKLNNSRVAFYSMGDSICKESEFDYGITIYELRFVEGSERSGPQASSESKNWLDWQRHKESRILVTRRLESSLIERRLVEKRYAAQFS